MTSPLRLCRPLFPSDSLKEARLIFQEAESVFDKKNISPTLDPETDSIVDDDAADTLLKTPDSDTVNERTNAQSQNEQMKAQLLDKQYDLVQGLYTRMMDNRRARYKAWLEMRGIECSRAADAMRVFNKTAMKWGMGSLPNMIAQQRASDLSARWKELKEMVLPQLIAQDQLFTREFEEQKARFNKMSHGDQSALASPVANISSVESSGSSVSSGSSALLSFREMPAEKIKSQTETVPWETLEPVRQQAIMGILQELGKMDPNKAKQYEAKLLMQGVRNAEEIVTNAQEGRSITPQQCEVCRMGTFPFLLCVIKGFAMDIENMFGKKEKDETPSKKGGIDKNYFKEKSLANAKKDVQAKEDQVKNAREGDKAPLTAELREMKRALAYRAWQEVQQSSPNVIAKFLTNTEAPKEQMRLLLEQYGDALSSEIKDSCTSLLQTKDLKADDTSFTEAHSRLIAAIATSFDFASDGTAETIQMTYQRKSKKTWESADACVKALEGFLAPAKNARPANAPKSAPNRPQRTLAEQFRDLPRIEELKKVRINADDAFDFATFMTEHPLGILISNFSDRQHTKEWNDGHTRQLRKYCDDALAQGVSNEGLRQIMIVFLRDSEPPAPPKESPSTVGMSKGVSDGAKNAPPQQPASPQERPKEEVTISNLLEDLQKIPVKEILTLPLADQEYLKNTFYKQHPLGKLLDGYHNVSGDISYSFAFWTKKHELQFYNYAQSILANPEIQKNKALAGYLETIMKPLKDGQDPYITGFHEAVFNPRTPEKLQKSVVLQHFARIQRMSDAELNQINLNQTDFYFINSLGIVCSAYHSVGSLTQNHGWSPDDQTKFRKDFEKFSQEKEPIFRESNPKLSTLFKVVLEKKNEQKPTNAPQK